MKVMEATFLKKECYHNDHRKTFDGIVIICLTLRYLRSLRGYIPNTVPDINEEMSCHLAANGADSRNCAMTRSQQRSNAQQGTDVNALYDHYFGSMFQQRSFQQNIQYLHLQKTRPQWQLLCWLWSIFFKYFHSKFSLPVPWCCRSLVSRCLLGPVDGEGGALCVWVPPTLWFRTKATSTQLCSVSAHTGDSA